MSNKNKLGKRERLRKGFAIATIITTIACSAITLANIGAMTMSSVFVGVVGALGALSSIALSVLVIFRIISRKVAIKSGKQDSLDAIRTIKNEIQSPTLSKEIAKQVIFKNYQKYLNASLKLCKNRGFAFTGLMKEMIPTSNADRGSLMAERYFVKQKLDFQSAIGDKHYSTTEKKFKRLSNRLQAQSKRNGEIKMVPPAYEDKYVLPEEGIEISGINQIYATNPSVISGFETLAKSSAIEDFGSLIKIDYKDDNFLPTIARYSDTSKTNQVKELLLREVEYLTQKHGESTVFPIEMTFEKDLMKNGRLQKKRNKLVARFSSLDDFRSQISGMER